MSYESNEHVVTTLTADTLNCGISHVGTTDDWRKDQDNIAKEFLKTEGAICSITMWKVSSKIMNCN